MFESLNTLYLRVELLGIDLITALAPEVPPVTVSPTTKFPVVTA